MEEKYYRHSIVNYEEELGHKYETVLKACAKEYISFIRLEKVKQELETASRRDSEVCDFTFLKKCFDEYVYICLRIQSNCRFSKWKIMGT